MAEACASPSESQPMPAPPANPTRARPMKVAVMMLNGPKVRAGSPDTCAPSGRSV